MGSHIRWWSSVALGLLLVACGDDPVMDDDGETTGMGGGGGAGGSAPTNLPPVAVDDSGETYEDAIIDIAVLSNDSDPNIGDQLSIQEATQPANGTVSVQGPALRYTPDPGFTGNDTFQYVVRDLDGLTDEGSVTVTVNPWPTLIITSPMNQDTVTGPDLAVTFQVTGCTMSSPSNNPDGCHVHKYLDLMPWSDGNGQGFGHYTAAGFTIPNVGLGDHTFGLTLIKNDGSDAPFAPLIEDVVSITVQ